MGKEKKIITVAIAGNPNCGKTSIFNALTGARQHVGNYPGVTVEKKTGFYVFNGTRYRIVDLPGTYSLTAFSEDEKVARRFLVEEKPDVVVDVVDASNMERNFYLVAHLLDLEINLVLVLNMWDMALAAGIELDLDIMSNRLRAPVVPTIGFRGSGNEELKKAIEHAAGVKAGITHVPMGRDIESEIEKLVPFLDKKTADSKYPARYLAIKLLEQDPEISGYFKDTGRDFSQMEAQLGKSIQRLKARYGGDLEVLFGDRRYGFAAGLLHEAIVKAPEFDRVTFSEQVDEVLTHRILGLPIFFLIIYGLFWMTFTLGSLPLGWIDTGFNLLGILFSEVVFNGRQSALESLIVDGVIGGVGGVLVFLPNIVLLFLGIALLEDTGYMARAAFIMDKVMHKIGLHGRSFIPILVGFGCTVPAILACRTLASRKDRLMTIMVLPLISCGARLPIYLLIIPSFFAFSYQPLVMFGIYMVGISLAMLISFTLHKTVFSRVSAPFVMELPPYRLPTIKGTLIHMWERSWMYLKKAGTIILGVSIVMWALSYYPRTTDFSIDRQINNGEVVILEENISAVETIGESGKILTREAYKNRKAGEQLRNSIAGKIGRMVEPVLRPLGFDWKIGTAMIGAFAAKEVFVAQLGIVYSLGETGENSNNLRDILRDMYTPLTGFCIMLFMLIATPCLATFAVVKKETGSWFWPVVQFIGLTALAYVLTMIVNLGGVFFFG